MRDRRHLRGRIQSGRMSCHFPATPKQPFAEGGWGGNLFPPHVQYPFPYPPRKGEGDGFY
jgi:hypothetical protein